ncbi:hypothetical protein ASG43_16130 [Aureimonas sp. Leaf454]|uniref:hypothetical protein n=1 Tax=Aureimonas sp. Leaf454 TaxID=1736381 RepID=UPI0006F1DA65|nr:hypothetical protein [Aureimonas sp. Leaf454]KQT43052.1 hypothetical protein ASG43_16130 [Aureimonas sp. Leaf454]
MAYEECVFINCPFDKEYAPLLQAMLFCVIYLGFRPRLATERSDAAENRLAKICELIKASKYSIHDLSRCQALQEGEHYRLNMPFELGIDYGCRQFDGGDRSDKKILVLEEKPYRYQISLSDMAGSDIQVHGAKFDVIIRKVRNWLVSEARIEAAGASRISNSYFDFQSWYFEKQIAAGFSEEDILDYPTHELLVAMTDWVDLGRPV